jgi:TPR repeat protein
MESQFRLARLYIEGKGVDADAAEAVKWYRSAAAQGHARAQAGLGFMLHTGRGADPDLAEAIQWYRKAAAQGRATAQFNLGKIHLDGEGVDVDEGEALRWFQMAANQDYPAALISLARMYEEGRAVERDPARAFKLTKRAAKDRYPEAEFQLGRMFAEGSGVAQDTKKAMHYYQRASNQGHANARAALDLMISTPGDAPTATETIATAALIQAPPAVVDTPQDGAEWTPQQQYEHGRALLFGDGVVRDPNRAEDWLRMAAEGGHGEAAYRLGLLLYRGSSERSKAYLPAYVWFARAAKRGIGDAATWRDRVYAKLNEREREEARRLLDP